MVQIEKILNHTVEEIETIFKNRFYEVKYNHSSVNKAVAKTIYNEKGFHFEFAKMIRTSQKDAFNFLESDNEIIEFTDLYDKLYFKIKQCSDFNFVVGNSGHTRVNGYIDDFTTNHKDEYSYSYLRAVILTKEKFVVSRYFSNANSLKVKNSTYGSGIIELKINDIELHLFGYDDKVTKKNYFIIETRKKSDFQKFEGIIDEIILSIAYLTGIFLGKSSFIFGSENEHFENNKLLSLKSFFDELKDGPPTIPDFHLHKDIVGNLENQVRPELLTKLVEELIKNLIYKRTLLLLCQAHTEPDYVKATLYSVALETITNLIYEKIKTKSKPIQDKILAKKIKTELKTSLLKYKDEITDHAFDKFNNDIDRLNSLTNKQKLLLPFKYFGINLPRKDIEAIEKRNDFLHGRIPEGADKHYLSIIVGRLLFCINLLVLKYINFKGYIFYPPAIYQYKNKLKIEERPLRKI